LTRTRLIILIIAVPAVLMIAAAWLIRGRPPWSPAGGGGFNVLLLTLDTTRADSLECYGGTGVKTPHIDALAAGGALFEQCTTCAPITLPAHTSLMTSVDPYVHGVRNNGMVLPADGAPTLAEILSGRGYRTGALISAFVLGSQFGLDQGFDFYDDAFLSETGSPGPGKGAGAKPPGILNERPADRVCDSALAWLEDHARGKGDGFFLWVHFWDPHEPYDPPPRFLRESGSAYLGEVAFVDEQVGRLLAELETLGLDDDTIVILIGDHGEGLGDHGEETHACFVYDSTLHVPLIIRAPGAITAGTTVSSQVRVIDVAPTVLDLLGLPPREDVQGTSLLPLARGERTENLSAYSETLVPRYDYHFSQLRSLRRGGWKYIHAPRPELYRVLDDPGETQNLAADEPDLVDTMRRHLRFLLAKAPLPDDGAAGGADAGTRNRLMALGYMGGWGDTPAGGEIELFDPEGEDPKDHVQGIALVQKGFEDLRRSRLPEARDLFLEAARLDPGWWVPKKMAALAVSQMGRPAEAIGLLEEVVAIHQGDAETLYLLGMLYTRVNELDKARDRIGLAAKADSTHIEARRWLATDAQREGAYGEAIRHCRDGLKTNPDDDYLLLLLAWILATCPYDEIRSGEEALKLAEKACSLTGSTNPLALRSLAAALAENGRFQEAVQKADLAARLAASQRNPALARRIEMVCSESFRKGRPHREKARREGN